MNQDWTAQQECLENVQEEKCGKARAKGLIMLLMSTVNSVLEISSLHGLTCNEAVWETRPSLFRKWRPKGAMLGVQDDRDTAANFILIGISEFLTTFACTKRRKGEG